MAPAGSGAVWEVEEAVKATGVGEVGGMAVDLEAEGASKGRVCVEETGVGEGTREAEGWAEGGEKARGEAAGTARDVPEVKAERVETKGPATEEGEVSAVES